MNDAFQDLGTEVEQLKQEKASLEKEIHQSQSLKRFWMFMSLYLVAFNLILILVIALISKQ